METNRKWERTAHPCMACITVESSGYRLVPVRLKTNLEAVLQSGPQWLQGRDRRRVRGLCVSRVLDVGSPVGTEFDLWLETAVDTRVLAIKPTELYAFAQHVRDIARRLSEVYAFAVVKGRVVYRPECYDSIRDK